MFFASNHEESSGTLDICVTLQPTSLSQGSRPTGKGSLRAMSLPAGSYLNLSKAFTMGRVDTNLGGFLGPSQLVLITWLYQCGCSRGEVRLRFTETGASQAVGCASLRTCGGPKREFRTCLAHCGRRNLTGQLFETPWMN